MQPPALPITISQSPYLPPELKRTLNAREKRLLVACLLTLFLVGNALAIREFTSRRKELVDSHSKLEGQARSNQMWLNERPYWEKRLGWLEKNMPYTNSAGKAQGQLLEDLRNSALDAGLKVENETPLASLELDHKNEVSVSLRIRGDQEIMIGWLLTLQSPEKFTAVKAIELELDSRSREKLPQAQCNLTVARWFNPQPPPGYEPPAPPAPVPADVPNPLELTTPLDGIVPLAPS